jgi:hypothetical protein
LDVVLFSEIWCVGVGFCFLGRAVEVPSGVWHFTDAFEDNTDNDEYEDEDEDEGSEPLDQFLSPGRDPCPQALYNLGVLQVKTPQTLDTTP